MSRIHEALKRAEQEKTSGQNGQKVEEFAAQPAQKQEKQPELVHANIAPPAAATATAIETLPEPMRTDGFLARCAQPAWKPDPAFLVFANSDPFYPGTEQFRTLRSRLSRIRENQPLKIVLISSAIPAEGKTVVATNLAHALVRQEGSRVLLIDADLRAPRVHTLLGAPSNPGLADYLQGEASEFEVIQKGHEEGLYFTPAGIHVTHPSELISSSRMKEFLERVKPEFDWIIIDSSPVLPVADATVLGGMSDGVLLVVRASSTPSDMARKACREFQDSHILGVVLNTADEHSEYGTYYSGARYGAPGTKKTKR
jgi:capsular exopolysaccharide synthesis family protein